MPMLAINGTAAPYWLPACRREGRRFRLREITKNSTKVMSGIGSSMMTLGKLNHFSKIRGLAHGVPIEIATTPRAVSHRLRLAHSTALSCKAPSVFMMSQLAPSRR